MGLGERKMEGGREMSEINNYEKRIAKFIHYPDCWYIAAYPTLADALWGMVNLKPETLCPSCGKKQFKKEDFL